MRRLQERPVLMDLVQAEALHALHDEAQRSVGELEHLVDVGERPDAEEVALDGIVDGGVALGDHADDLALPHRVVHEGHRALAGHGQGQDGVREQDGVAQGQDGEVGGHLGEVDLADAARFEVRRAVVLVAHSSFITASPSPEVRDASRPAVRRAVPGSATRGAERSSAGSARSTPCSPRPSGSPRCSWQSRQSSGEGQGLQARLRDLRPALGARRRRCPASRRRMASSMRPRVSAFICTRANSMSWAKSVTLCSSASWTSGAGPGIASRMRAQLVWISCRRSSSICLQALVSLRSCRPRRSSHESPFMDDWPLT